MPGKVFVSYRRDDERSTAARIRDRLAAAFGHANVFMDVDNLLAGQRFDRELEKALDQTEVFLAVIGPRWLELLAERQISGEHDYVREEIAGALQRGIVVIPVLIERTPLPHPAALPEDIRKLALHQRFQVSHERFGRDLADLVHAIKRIREKPLERRDTDIPWQRIGWTCLVVSGFLAGFLAVATWAGREFAPPDPYFVKKGNTKNNAKSDEEHKAEQDRKWVFEPQGEAWATQLALNNYGHEIVECAAYYIVISESLKTRADSGALSATYKQAGTDLLERALIIADGSGMKRETVTARAQTSIKSMMDEIGGNPSNTSILLQRYHMNCKAAAENAKARLGYWMEKAVEEEKRRQPRK